MRQALVPMLFWEEDPAAARTRRALLDRQDQATTKCSEDGLSVHSLETLLQDLATLTKNRMQFGQASFEQVAKPTTLQHKAFEL